MKAARGTAPAPAWWPTSTGKSPRGAGLGLSLVKSLIELHGGWVELDSEPGGGTRVTCHLPTEPAASPGRRQPTPPLSA